MSCQDSLFIDMLIANPFKIWLKVRQRGSERGVICCGLHAGASACVVHHWLLSDLKRCRCCRQHVITRGESLYWICGWGYCLCRQKSSSFGHCFEVKSSRDRRKGLCFGFRPKDRISWTPDRYCRACRKANFGPIFGRNTLFYKKISFGFGPKPFRLITKI